MREIVLAGESHDSQLVRATMQFPNDDEMRYNVYLALRLSAELEAFNDSETLTLPRETVRALMASPSEKELIAAARNATKRGILAGDLLNGMFIMVHFNLDEPSMNKAIYCAKQFNARTTFKDGSPFPKSEAVLRRAWDEFRCVAHLWGAYRLNAAYPFVPDHRAMFSAEHLPTFLSVAAALQEFGLSFVPKRARPPLTLLDAEDVFRIPASVRPARLQTERRPERVEAWLSQYEAPLNNAWA